MIKRGEVYWVGMDPALGAEIKKTRPGIIVSNDVNNVHAPTVTVIPLTTSVHRVYPFEVLLAPKLFGNKSACKAKTDQVRTVDKRRLGAPLGLLPRNVMAQIEQALRRQLGL